MLNDNQSLRQHSLQADLVTGWKPKLKIIGPMPLNFDNPTVDNSIEALLSSQSAFYCIVYLGSRPTSTFKLHELVQKNYKYKYKYLLNNNFAHLKSFFNKFYSQFEPQVRRPYFGMSKPIAKHDLIFDSCFQGGNLDCAVRLRLNQYDMLMRVDSNTAGHIMWFDFKVTNLTDKPRKVRLNLANLRNIKSAYSRGLRPYIKRQNRQWQQQNIEVSVTEQMLKYYKQNFTLSLQDNVRAQQNFRKISFQLQFQPNQTVQLAYCIPYTYSQLLQDIKGWKKQAATLPGVQFQVDLNHQSLSGLQIPLLRVREGQSANGKYCIFMIARQHPGQSNSSHTLKGSIDKILCGDQLSMALLRNCQFVIIPMLNPDGVVAGNFRTSLFGKDLNRLFMTKDTTLIPQIQMARGVFTDLYQVYKRKLLLFLDYHGHSTRKNAFVLGPGIFDAQIMNDIRILPRIMAQYSQIFRYPSCSFRLQECKKTTARALFGKLAGLSYTIEASNWSYYCKRSVQVIDFTAKLWEELGSGLIQAVRDYVATKIDYQSNYRQRMNGNSPTKSKIFKTKPIFQAKNASIRQIQGSSASPSPKKPARVRTQTKIDSSVQLQIHQDHNLCDFPQEVLQANQSDQMSDKGMDSDSDGQDMNKQKFKKYIKAASDMLVQFEKVYYGDQYRKGLSKYRFDPKNNTRSTKLLLQRDKSKKEEPIIHLQACLRPKEKKNPGTPQISLSVLKIKSKMILNGQKPAKDNLKTLNQVTSVRNQVSRQTSTQNKRQLRKSDVQIKQKLRLSGSNQERKTSQLIKVGNIKQKDNKLDLSSHKDNKRPVRRAQAQLRVNPLFMSHTKEEFEGLPVIKPVKPLLVEQYSSRQGHNANKYPNQKIAQLLSSQKQININSVMNILRLSRITQD